MKWSPAVPWIQLPLMLFMSSHQATVMTDGGGERSASICRGTGGSANSPEHISSPRTSLHPHTHVTDLHKVVVWSVTCYCRAGCLDVIFFFFIIQSSQEAVSDGYRSRYTFIPVGVMCHLDTIQPQWEHEQQEKMGGGGKQEKSNHALDEYSHRCFLCLFSHKYGGTAKIHMAKNLWTMAHATLLIHHDCITLHFTCIGVLQLDWWSGSCRCRVTPKFINFYRSDCDLWYVCEICLKYDQKL